MIPVPVDQARAGGANLAASLPGSARTLPAGYAWPARIRAGCARRTAPRAGLEYRRPRGHLIPVDQPTAAGTALPAALPGHGRRLRLAGADPQQGSALAHRETPVF